MWRRQSNMPAEAEAHEMVGEGKDEGDQLSADRVVGSRGMEDLRPLRRAVREAIDDILGSWKKQIEGEQSLVEGYCDRLRYEALEEKYLAR